MSLLQRVEKAQRAAEGIDAPSEARDETSALDTVPSAKAATSAGEPGATASPTTAPAAAPRTPRTPAREALLVEIRRLVQVEVIGSFHSLLEATDAKDVRAMIAGMIDRIVAKNTYAITREERMSLIDEVVHEVTGLGPLEPLLADETITEVMVNGPDNIFIERSGKIQRVDVTFINDDHVRRIIDRIIAPLGRRIDESSPRVDARLPDGSRVNAVIAPLSLIGPVITIRKFSARPYTVRDLVRFGTGTPAIFNFLRMCILARLNVFVSGGTGSGKTTFLNVLSSFIPEDERIVTIEDAAELQLRQEHVVTLEARPANAEGSGEVTIRDLLRNALHMRPDRIIVGECRSAEALDMIQAMMTGQDGSLSTGHANTTQDMLRRLETMILMSGYELPLRAIREQIASAVDVIVHTARLKDGTRKIVNITEVFGIEEDEILTQDIFAFDQTDFVDGKVIGELKPTGIRPTFMGVFKSSGLELPKGEFGIPPADPKKPIRPGKSRWAIGAPIEKVDESRTNVGLGRAVKAGGMVYVTSVGPINPATGQLIGGDIRDQARQCLTNLKTKLEEAGSTLEKVVWANWSLKESSEFDIFNEEWIRGFPGDPPVGQGTLMSASHRRAGFRVSIGVIAEA